MQGRLTGARARVCRVNISNAAVLGLKEDLDIVTGTKYNTALTIFFVPYIIFEIPSNILLKRLKPHIWRTFSLWGCFCDSICDSWLTRFSIAVHVRVRSGYDFPGPGEELGWSDGYSVVFGCVHGSCHLIAIVRGVLIDLRRNVRDGLIPWVYVLSLQPLASLNS